MAKGKYAEWLKPEKLILLTGWARDGLTDEQIAHNIGINVKTLWDWKTNFNPICNALKEGKEVADREIENALYLSAKGHTAKVKKAIKVKTVRQDGSKKIEEEHIEYIEDEIYIPPNTTAQIYWLKNRKPNEWREKPQAEITDAERVIIVDDFK